MLDEQTAAETVATFVGVTCGIPEARRFAYPQSTKTAELPDVAAACTTSRVQQGGDEVDFPLAAIENVWMTVFVVDFSIMVEQGETDAQAGAAQAQVYGYAKAIREALIADPSLGEILNAQQGQAASPLVEFDFTAPFVEYEDKTRGRVTPGTMRLGQSMPEPG